MNNDEPMCECGHELSGHYKHGCNEVERGPDYEQCHCEQFTDARLAVLRAEIARLTPTATRELPTKEGWYYRSFYVDFPQVSILEVRDDGYGTLSINGRSLSIYRGGWWSRDPLPEMTIPKGETE